MSRKITEMTTEERTQLRKEALVKKHALFDNFIQENPYKLKSFFLRLPETVKLGWLKCFFGNASKTEVIKQKCLDCSIYNKTEITKCVVHQCPLYQYRPYQKKEEKNEE